MAKWIVRFAIHGTGWAKVEAESADDAKAMVSTGPYITEPQIEEWDISNDAYPGGYIDAEEN